MNQPKFFPIFSIVEAKTLKFKIFKILGQNSALIPMEITLENWSSVF